MRAVPILLLTCAVLFNSCFASGKGDKPLPPPVTEDNWNTPDFQIPKWETAFTDVKMTSLAQIPESLRAQIGVPSWGLVFHRGSAFWTTGDSQGFRGLWVCNGKEVFKILDEADGLWRGSLGQISRWEEGPLVYIYAVLGYHMGLNLSSGWTLNLDTGVIHRDAGAFNTFSAKDFTSMGWDTAYLLGEEFFSWKGDHLAGIFQEKGQSFLYLYDGKTFQKQFPMTKTTFPLNGQINDRGNYVFAGVENFDDFNGFQYWTLMEVDNSGKTLLNHQNTPQTAIQGLLGTYGLKELKRFNQGGTDSIQSLSSGVPMTIGNATLYTSADSSSPVLETIPEGSTLEILETQKTVSILNGLKAPWMKVRTIRGKEGWVFGAMVEEKQVFSYQDPLTWNDFQIIDGSNGARILLGTSWKALKKTYEAIGHPGKILTKQDQINVLDPTITTRVFFQPDMEMGDFGTFIAGAPVSSDQVNVIILKDKNAMQRRGIQVGQGFQAAMSTLGKGPSTSILEYENLGHGRSYGFKLAQDSQARYFLLHLGADEKVKGLFLFDGAFQD